MITSEEYIQALITGNSLIIKKIYNQLYPKIERFVTKNQGDRDDALDVFHDALMYIIVTQKEKAKPIDSFEAYLFVICKNLWKKTLKKRVTKVEDATLVDETTDLSLFILEQEYFDFYIEKFNCLSQNCKELLSSYFNGLNYQEIVKEYSYATVNTARQRIFKCRTKLIQLIKEDERFKRIRKAYKNQ